MSADLVHLGWTQHAFLVLWGYYAQHIGLLAAWDKLEMRQKLFRHTMDTKVLELLVATMAGLKYLQDISQEAHPLVRDIVVARAWGRPAWADYTGVSRAAHRITWETAVPIVQLLEQIGAPFLSQELGLLRTVGRRLCYDGDLTGIPVSNTSTTYPNAAYGHMDDDICLGYQAALVSLQSPTYGRLWIAGSCHPGNTVASTVADALVGAAEAITHLRPLRRTALLTTRLAQEQAQLTKLRDDEHAYQQKVTAAEAHVLAVESEVETRGTLVKQLESRNAARGRPERPAGQLARARRSLRVSLARRQRRCAELEHMQARLGYTRARVSAQHAVVHGLQERLARFEHDNATNAIPVVAEFRLDAGFGSCENVALLAEMGYEVYTKPLNNRILEVIRRRDASEMSWARVGANAELVAWPAMTFESAAYPLDTALQRFYTGQQIKYHALWHYGDDKVTQDLAAWFEHYNHRQTIEMD